MESELSQFLTQLQLNPTLRREREREVLAGRRISYEQAQQMLAAGQFVHHEVVAILQTEAHLGNTLVTLVDVQGNRYTVSAKYDPQTQRINPPTEPITVTFEGTYPDGEENIYVNMEYPIEEISRLYNPNRIVIPMNRIVLLYDYPLENEATFEHTSQDPRGFTRAEVARLASQDYHRIYEEEETVPTVVSTMTSGGMQPRVDPGMVPGMLNRETTSGRYGIWGHGIGDLVLHTVRQVEGNLFRVEVDS